MTPKLERFCQEIVKGLSQADAYRVAYKPKRMKAKTIHNRASELATSREVTGRVAEIRGPVIEAVQWSLVDRMKELSYAGQFDPLDLVDEHDRPRSMKDIPERARRAITSIEIDPEKFITKIKFDSKRGSTMDYTRLAGDMPSEKHEITGTITVEHLVELLTHKDPKVING